MLALVAERFGLGGVLSSHRVTQGVSNSNWKLTTTTGAYAIKQLRDATPQDARHQHRVLPRLAGLGLPVPLPCTTEAGETLVRVADDFYAATPWLPGSHRIGGDLGLDACAALGDLLARLEVVRSATILFATGDERGVDLDRIAAFVRAYRRRIPLSDEDLADAAHRRWWRLVCATWPLRFHYDEGDPSCDHLFVSIGQVLRWWTGHFAELTGAVTAR